MSEYVYTPSKWGNIYHNVVVDELLGAGSQGPGKTQVLLNDANPQIFIEHKRCEQAIDHPYPLKWGDSVGWALHLRRVVPQLSHTIERSRKIFPAIDPKVKWYGSDNMWEFSSGFKFQFGHCKDPDDWENYESTEFTHVAFDELVQFNEVQYDRIALRCRTSDPVLRRMKKVRAMSNPMTKTDAGEKIIIHNPHWVRDRFVEPCRAGNKILKVRVVRSTGEIEWVTRMYLPARLSDNPNKEFVRDQEVALLKQKPHIRKALLDGDWYVTADSFYTDAWDERLHVCRPFKIPDDWKRFRTLDWGFKKPGRAYWWAMDPEGTLWCYRELCFLEKTDVQVAMLIMEIDLAQGFVKHGRSLLTGPADTQLWEERGESAKTKAAMMASKGVYWTKADKKSRKHNAEKLTARLKDHNMGKATPGIMFFNTCRKMIETLPMIQTDPDDIESPADGGDDHSHDNVLYACAYASRGTIGMPKPPPRGEFDKDDDTDEVKDRRVNRGKLGYGV